MEVDNGQLGRKNTVIAVNGVVVADEKTLVVETLERNLTDRNTREMSNVVKTVKGRIEKAILTDLDRFITQGIQLAVRSMKA